MKEIILNEDHVQFQSKTVRVSFSFFLFTLLLISLLAIGYISSNIVVMRLGYQSMEMEQKRDQLLLEKNRLEYTVENLSSLTRIEQIAIQELGMQMPERIEFIAMLPAKDIQIPLASNTFGEEPIAGYIEAGIFPGQLSDLQIFKNR